MSYSFSAKGTNKELALQDATAKFDAMVEQQPVHSRDREAALSNLRANLDLVTEPAPDEDIGISMYGSISVHTDAANAFGRVTNVGNNCSITVSRRATTPTTI
jgi:hypothetical protein